MSARIYYRLPFMPDRRVFELWHFGATRCRMTPREGGPPFRVTIYEGDRVASHQTFDDHDEAITFAVEQLRIATHSN